MTPLWLIRFGNGVRRGSGISTTCYPAPAAIHGSLSSDKERLKLCLRVQTPAPILGRTSRNRSGYPGCVGGASPRGGDSSPTPQPPTSSTVVDPDGLYQTRWWAPAHSVTWRHVRFLRLRRAGQCPALLPTPQCEQPDLATAREAQRIALPPHPNAGLDPATVLNVYGYTVWLG